MLERKSLWERAKDFGKKFGKDLTEFFDPVKDAYDTVDSFIGFSDFADDVGDLFDNPLVQKFAGGVGDLYSKKDASKSGRTATPTAKRPTSRATSTAGSFQSTPVDLGFTPRVQNAMRVAGRAAEGTAVRGTVDALRNQRAKGPLLQVSQSQIRVSPRSRSNA